MVCLSKASPSCLAKIREFINQPRDAAPFAKNAAKSHSMSNGKGAAPLPDVQFEQDENSGSSDEESTVKKLRFTDVQKSIRQRIRCIQRGTTKSRKPSGRKDYGEKVSGHGADDEAADLQDDAEIEDNEETTNADDVASVDFEESLGGEVMDDEDEILTEHDESFIDDFSELKEALTDAEPGQTSSSRRFEFSGHSVPERLQYYLPILESHGYTFGDLGAFGYPLSIHNDEGSTKGQSVRERRNGGE